MNWRLIFLLSLVGLGVAFATVFHFSPKMEQFVWLIVFIGSAFLIARYCDDRYFKNGFILGIINCFWVVITHLLYFPQYLNHHKTVAVYYAKLPAGFSPYAALVIIEISKGLFTSFVCGSFAYVMAAGMKKLNE